MPTRDLVVRLRGNEADLIRAYRAAEQAALKHGAVMQRQAKQQQKDSTEVGRVFLGIGAAAGVGLGAMVKAGMGFDKAMSGVKAVTNASAADMNRLREAAIKAGKDTVFSASEAARAEAELAKAGIATSDILGGALKGSLSLAAAGQLDLGEAATISAQAMNIFKLRGSDVGHIADVLAAGANKSAADVHQLGDALRAGGLVAAQTGLTLEDTVGALSAFADRALIGSDAGTSLKTMLLALNPKSNEAATLMKRLGITAYDASGQFVGLEAFAGRLQKGLGGLTAEQRNSTLATIFGTDAVRGANVLYELGSAGVAKYTAAVNDQGAASRMAATQLDNLAGDLEALKGSIETALIQSGSHANGVLREMVQTATGVVNIYSDLPKPVQAAGTALTGLATVAGLAGGAFFLGAPKVKAFKDSLETMGPRAQTAGRALSGTIGLLGGPWGVALAGATVGLGFFAQKHAAAKQRVDALTEAIIADAGAMGEMTRATVVARLEEEGLLRSAQDLGINLKDVTDAALGNAEAQARVSAAIGRAYDNYRSVNLALQEHKNVSGEDVLAAERQVSAAGKLQQALGGVTGDLAKGRDAASRNAEAMGKTTGATKDATGASQDLGVAQQGLTGDLQDTRTAAEKLKDELDRLNGVQVDLMQAQLNYHQTVADSTKAVRENGHTHSFSTQKGRDNQRQLLAQADAAREMAKAVLAETGSEAKFQANLQTSRRDLIASARQMGYSKTAAEALADRILRIPRKAETKVSAPGAKQATGEVKSLRDRLYGLPGSTRAKVSAPGARAAWSDARELYGWLSRLDGMSVQAAVTIRESYYSLSREHMNRRAHGGPIEGYSPTPTTDNIPVWATAGEHMWSVREVQGAGGHGNVRRLRDMARTGTLQLAAGGPVMEMLSGGSLANMRIAADITAVLPEAKLHKSFATSLKTTVVPELKEVNQQLKLLRTGATRPAVRRLTAQQISNLGDTARFGYVRAHGLPAAPSGYRWAEDYTLVRTSFYAKPKPKPRPLTAQQISNLDPDSKRFAYVRAHGLPRAPSGYAWAEDYTLVRRGFYDFGGWLPPGLSLAYNGTGRPERVLSPVASSRSPGGAAEKGGVTTGDVIINNPVPEKASDSVPRVLRQLAYTLGP